MLSFEVRPGNTELRFDVIREDVLTACYRAVLGKPLHYEIRRSVIPGRTDPLELDKYEWLSLLQGLDVSDSVSNSIEETIIEHLIDVPEVVEVYFSRDRDVVDLWTIIDHSERRVRFAVYEKELEIRRRLPGLFINFRVSGREASSSPASMGYRRVDFNVRRTNAGHQRSPRPGKA